ncbi:MAG: hypothetical protein LIO72_07865, partial [Ruminococcus sp.]|nr:hypothetical protein [Ruminococcus sp.]
EGCDFRRSLKSRRCEAATMPPLCEIPMKYPRKMKNTLEKRGGGDYNLSVGIFFLNHGKGQYDAEVFCH